MKCANPLCNTEGLYLRSGTLHAIDSVVEDAKSPERRSIRRKIIWLCGRCTGILEVETWRPPGQQLQPRKHQANTTFGSVISPPRLTRNVR